MIDWRPNGVQATLRAMRCALALAVILLTPLLPAVSEAAPSGFTQLRDQGIEYYKRGRHQPAIATLRKAAETPEGKSDFRTWYNLTKVHYAITDIESALPAAQKAVECAKSDRHRRQAKAFLKQITEFFAGVEIRQAADQQGQVEYGYIHLEDTIGLINTKKKEAFRKIRERFRTTKVRLPLTIYLPFGAYTANLAPFDIEKGATATAETYLYVPDSEAEESGPAWWYVGGGAVVAAGAVTALVLLNAEEPPAKRRVTVPTIRFEAP